MMVKIISAVVVQLILYTSFVFCQPSAGSDTQEILNRFVISWKGEKELNLEGRDQLQIAFKIRQDGNNLHYHADLYPKGSGRLHKGMEDHYLVEFEMDLETLHKLDRGIWSPNTALGAEFNTDETPLKRNPSPELRQKERYWETEEWNFIRKLTFHFWNRNWPEIVPMGEQHARNLHGANSVLLYYENDLRVGWVQLKDGMEANEDKRLQANPFPTLLVVTKGNLRATIDEEHLILRKINRYLSRLKSDTDFGWKAMNMEKVFCSCLSSFKIRALTNREIFYPETNLLFGKLAGFGWVALSVAVIALFERRSWKYMFINGGYMVIAFMLMGAVLGIWR